MDYGDVIVWGRLVDPGVNITNPGTRGRISLAGLVCLTQGPNRIRIAYSMLAVNARNKTKPSSAAEGAMCFGARALST